MHHIGAFYLALIYRRLNAYMQTNISKAELRLRWDNVSIHAI